MHAARREEIRYNRAPVLRRRSLLLGAALLFGAALVAPAAQADGRAPARSLGTASAAWDGLSRFVELARAEPHGARVDVGESLPVGALTPADALILIHPTDTLDVDSLTEFLRGGGRVILFDDFGTGEALAEHFGIRRVGAPEAPKETIRGNVNLPVARPTGVHPTIADVPFVVLNHATALDHPSLSTVLVIREQSGREVVVGVAGAVGRGRLFVVSDASAVMNGMLKFSGNRAFAAAVLRYAVEDDAWGERGGVVYIRSGSFPTTGTLAPRGPVEEAVARTVARLRDEGRKAASEGLGADGSWALAIAAAALLLQWLRKRAGTLHRIEPPRWGKAPDPLAAGGVGGHAALLQSNYLTGSLHVLEWQHAIEELVAARLAAVPLPPQPVWLDRLVHEGWIDGLERAQLADALARVAHLETAQLARGAVREPSAADVAAMIAPLEALARRLGGDRAGPPSETS